MRRCLRNTIFAALVIAFVIVLFRRPMLDAAGSWLDVGEVPQTADFVVLLPGHERTRAYVVAGLVTKEYCPTAIIIPTKHYASEESGGLLAQHAVGRAVLESQGLMPWQIVQMPDHENASTFSDAESIKRFLEEQAEECRVVVVTNDFHTRRARWAFTQVLQDRMQQVRFVSAPSDFHSAKTWSHSARGMEAYLSEYFKLSYYMLRYNRQNRILFVSVCSVVFLLAVLMAIRCGRRKAVISPSKT